MQEEMDVDPDGLLWLAPDERQWLAQTLSLAQLRAQAEFLLGESDPRAMNARRLRATLLALSLDETPEPLPASLSADELWLLDMHFSEYDLRDAKLPSGRLLLEFARKVWVLLTQIHQGELPPALRKGTYDAREDADPDESANAIAEAEALLRPTEDTGTG